jgi:hypothetical protein
VTNEEGVPGEEASSPGLLANLLARGRWCRWGSDARRSSANVRHPATTQVEAVQPFALDGLPGDPGGAGHGRWRVRDAPSARAASLASSAARPRPPSDPVHPALLLGP